MELWQSRHMMCVYAAIPSTGGSSLDRGRARAHSGTRVGMSHSWVHGPGAEIRPASQSTR